MTNLFPRVFRGKAFRALAREFPEEANNKTESLRPDRAQELLHRPGPFFTADHKDAK